MTNLQVLELYYSLQKVNIRGVTVSYAISKNLAMLESEAKHINSSQKPSERFEEYEKKRALIAAENSKKNDSGDPVVSEGRYVIADLKKFEQELSVLKQEYKEELERRESQLKEYEKFLEAPSNYKPFCVSLRDIPDDISTSDMNALYHILKTEDK